MKLFGENPKTDMDIIRRDSVLQIVYSREDSEPRNKYRRLKSKGVLFNKAWMHVLGYIIGWFIFTIVCVKIRQMSFSSAELVSILIMAGYMLIGILFILKDVIFLVKSAGSYREDHLLLDAMDRQIYLMKDGSVWAIDYHWTSYHEAKQSDFSPQGFIYPFKVLYKIERVYAVEKSPLFIHIAYDGVKRELITLSSRDKTFPYEEHQVMHGELLLANCVMNIEELERALEGIRY